MFPIAAVSKSSSSLTNMGKDKVESKWRPHPINIKSEVGAPFPEWMPEHYNYKMSTYVWHQLQWSIDSRQGKN